MNKRCATGICYWYFIAKKMVFILIHNAHFTLKHILIVILNFQNILLYPKFMLSTLVASLLKLQFVLIHFDQISYLQEATANRPLHTFSVTLQVEISLFV